MNHHLSLLQLLFLLCILAVFTPGCSSQKRLQLTDNDASALQRIQDISPWSFRQSRLELEVHQGGAVEVIIEGQAMLKDKSEGGILWLPVALLRELPQYFTCTEESDQKPLDLQSYKVAGGLWCIAAIIPLPRTAAPSVEPSSAERRTTVLRVRTLMLSSDFSSGLPLLIPAGQGRAEVDTRVTLPNNTAFRTQEVVTRSESAALSTKLIPFPSSLSQGAVTGVARLSPTPAAAWDFSDVTYYSKSVLIRPFIEVSLVLCLVVAVVWTIYKRRQVSRERRNWYLREEYESGRMSDPRLEELDQDARFEVTKKYLKKKYLQNLEERDKRRKSDLHYDLYRRESMLWEFRGPLSLLFFATAALILLAFFAPWVLAQASPQPSAEAVPVKMATLGELGMAVQSNLAQSDRLTVAFNFFALTDAVDSQGMTEIAIGIGDNSRVNIEEVKSISSDRVKVTQQSPKRSRLSVPANTTSALGLLQALSNLNIEQLRLPADYLKALNDSNFVKLEYTLSGAQSVSERNQGGWLHWFPYDTKAMEIPLELTQPAIISKIEIQRPIDFVGDVSANGMNASFIEGEKEYKLDRGQSDSRLTIPPHEQITLKAQFRRTRFQRFFLTYGQILIAVISGVILGYLSSLPDKSVFAAIIQGIGVLGLPWIMRSSVFSSYKELPTLLSGQAPTVFEVVFLISWVLYAATTILTAKRLKQ